MADELDRRSAEGRQATAPGERRRQVAALILGGLAVAFALANLDEVRVNWLLGTWRTPLIVVIAVCVAAGMLLDRVVLRRRRRPQGG